MDVKIISVIVGALLGGAVSTIGFYFKNKREVREKINESLFHLLEVWTLIAMVRVTTSDKFFSTLVERIKKRFPYEEVGESEKASIKEGMVKALPFLTGVEVHKIDGQLLVKYRSSVNELAKIYPLLAFELNRNQMLIRFLGAVDKLASEIPMDEGDEAALVDMREFMMEESFKDLEADLVVLAAESSYKNKRETKLHI